MKNYKGPMRPGPGPCPVGPKGLESEVFIAGSRGHKGKVEFNIPEKNVNKFKFNEGRARGWIESIIDHEDAPLGYMEDVVWEEKKADKLKELEDAKKMIK